MKRLKKLDLSGIKFGKLLVLEVSHKGKKGQVYWKCLCDCGNLYVTRADGLTTGHTTSCGCNKRSIKSSGSNYDFFTSSIAFIYSNRKKTADNRGLTFNLSSEEFSNLIQSRCYYCDSDLSNIFHNPTFNLPFKYNGIDRLDSNIGYEIGNCVPCCKICNNAKNILSEEEFLNWVGRVYKFKLEN